MISESVRILCENVSRQRHAFAGLLDFDTNGTSAGGGAIGLAKHRKLAEHLAVDLGDKVVLCVRLVAPNLSELNCLNGHVDRLMFGFAARQCSAVDLFLFGNVDNMFQPRCAAKLEFE